MQCVSILEHLLRLPAQGVGAWGGGEGNSGSGLMRQVTEKNGEHFFWPGRTCSPPVHLPRRKHICPSTFKKAQAPARRKPQIVLCFGCTGFQAASLFEHHWDPLHCDMGRVTMWGHRAVGHRQGALSSKEDAERALRIPQGLGEDPLKVREQLGIENSHLRRKRNHTPHLASFKQAEMLQSCLKEIYQLYNLTRTHVSCVCLFF